MSSQQLPVAVGRDRQHASSVFGQSFDRLLLTTYDEGAATASGFVGVAADPGMHPGLEWALGLLAHDAALEVAVELPRDAALSADVGGWLVGTPTRIVGVRRYGDHPCVLLAAADHPLEPDQCEALLAAAVQQAPALVDDLERTGSDWELAAHKARTDHLERQVRDVRVQLGRKRGEARALHLLAERNGLLPDTPARARQHVETVREIQQEDQPAVSAPGIVDRLSRVLGAEGQRGRTVTLALVGVAGLVGLAALVVLVVLLSGGGAVRVALAVVLLLLAALVGGVLLLAGQVRTTLAELRGTEIHLVDRLGALERLSADLVTGLGELPDRVPVADAGPEVDQAAERLQLTATLYALAPPAADVAPMSRAVVDLAVAAVGELLDVRPGLVVTTGAPEVALFAALAVRRHDLLGTRVVALDDDPQAARALTERAARHGVGDVLESRHAPLGRSGIEGHRTAWYAAGSWSDLSDIGLAVVAGPADVLGPHARLPFVPLLADRLAGRFSVLLPDPGDDVVEAWSGVLPTAAVGDLGPIGVALRG